VEPTSGIDRRDLLKLGAAGAGLAVVGGLSACGGDQEVFPSPEVGAAPESPFAVPPIDNVRIGFVGVGGQGSEHVRNLLGIEGCTIQAVCDIVPEKVERAQGWVEEAGFDRPTAYTRGERDFERMCAEQDLDLVFNATPWEWHVPICVSAMENGKHTATEVPAAYTIDDCWKLVESAGRSYTAKVATFMISGRSNFRRTVKDSGVAPMPCFETATCTRHMGWGLSPIAWTSIGATGSPVLSR